MADLSAAISPAGRIRQPRLHDACIIRQRLERRPMSNHVFSTPKESVRAGRCVTPAMPAIRAWAPEWEGPNEIGSAGRMAFHATSEMTMSRTTKTQTANITPEALQAMFDSMAELKATVAKYQAEAEVATKAMTDKPAKISVSGKTDAQIKGEIATVRAFKKAGYGVVKPREDVRSFRLWALAGYRPKEGSKAVKVGQFRLFHKDQVRKLTSEEKAATKEQSEAAVARHTKGKATVTPLHPVNPQ
jgi:hypothetical protein